VRPPVEVLFSLTEFQRWPAERVVRKFGSMYLSWLRKWVGKGPGAGWHPSVKAVLSYNDLLVRPVWALNTALVVLTGEGMPEEVLMPVWEAATKDKTRSLTPHNPRAMRTREEQRAGFYEEWGPTIRDKFAPTDWIFRADA